jgi:death-on-curing protein
MKPLCFLYAGDLILIHAACIDRFGGARGLRDEGLLESAVSMPRAQFGGRYLHPGIPAMAAAYLFHLCKNHPFLDGYKRAAFAASEAFILANGYRLNASDDEMIDVTLGVAEGRISKVQAISFFKKKVRKARKS